MKWVTASAFCVGLIVGVLSLMVAFSHNSQGAYIDTETGSVDLSQSAILFLVNGGIAFVLAWGPIAILASLFLFIRQRFGQ
ncbi:hypothetical protein ACFSM5_02145 [Lacibacterium aquatile]|uniref:Uncharacterized protein n=1 Tax=Lacibacterium aquatile TaxID=1168082 RepID=A0ABW5DQS8_9PROT